MSHQLYHTKAFVLKTQDLGEASRMITLYTRELGLVTARAQGVRKLSSKLRYSLPESAIAEVSLVRGREFWRITGAVPDERIHLPRTFSEISLRGRIFSLLFRLIHGEGANKELFDVVYRGFVFLAKNPHTAAPLLEVGLVLKILFHLGYLDKTQGFEQVIKAPEWSEEFLGKLAGIRREAIFAINSALRETQL